jgi:hypothetical protein
VGRGGGGRGAGVLGGKCLESVSNVFSGCRPGAFGFFFAVTKKKAKAFDFLFTFDIAAWPRGSKACKSMSGASKAFQQLVKHVSTYCGSMPSKRAHTRVERKKSPRQ